MKTNKRGFISLALAVLITITILPTTAFAANVDTEYKAWLSNNKEFMRKARVDEYTLNALSFPSDLLEDGSEQSKVVKQITAGITSDYGKAKVIADWMFDNFRYEYSRESAESYKAEGVPSWLIGECVKAADSTTHLFRLAGLPAMAVRGKADGVYGWAGHSWTIVYVDNRWVYADTVWMEFDLPVEEWSRDHSAESYVGLSHLDWSGTLEFRNSQTGQTIKVVDNQPLGARIDTQGYDPKSIYLNPNDTEPFDFSNRTFHYQYRVLYVKHHKVSFYEVLDNAYKSIVNYVFKEDANNMLSHLEVATGQKASPVKPPVRDGYTFIGWTQDNIPSPASKLWDFGTPITEDIYLTAVFKKGNINYKVDYNINGGTAVKSITVKANTTLKQPATPTKNGYKFTGWYKDSACTKAWDFKEGYVSANTTLYAGWLSNNNAKPTASTVLVNNISTKFEAYNINNNNYFKLRDLAQVVNNTEKNFEVGWDGTKNAINLISNSPYTPAGGELNKGDGKAKAATLTTSTIYKDGKVIKLTAYNINGNNYFKLRDIAKSFDIGITWDGKTSTIGIDTSIGYVED